MQVFPLERTLKNRLRPSPFARDYLSLTYDGSPNMSYRVQKIISNVSILPLAEAMFKAMDEIKSMLKYVFQTKNDFTFALQASSFGGIEAILINLLNPGEKLLACGETHKNLLLEIADRHKLQIEVIDKKDGKCPKFEEIEARLKIFKPQVLFITHAESSGGPVQNLKNLGSLCHKFNCLLAVDAIYSLAIEELFVDRWEIDAVLGTSENGIGSCNGFSLVTCSPLAVQKIINRKRKPPYFFDLVAISKYWKCFPEPRIYVNTYSSNWMGALREALAEICEEGLINVWERQKATSLLFRKNLQDLGLRSDPLDFFVGVTNFQLPENVNARVFLNRLKNEYGIDLTSGYCPKKNMMRVSFRGMNKKNLQEFIVEKLQHEIK